MPPRFADWTILIDDKPTAFRAREREELQPTFTQLQRKNTNVVMRWFARGKLWASREAERDDFQMQRQRPWRLGSGAPMGRRRRSGGAVTGVRVALTRIRAIGSRRRIVPSVHGPTKIGH